MESGNGELPRSEYVFLLLAIVAPHIIFIPVL